MKSLRLILTLAALTLLPAWAQTPTTGNVTANRNTGTLVSPSAATFIDGNGLITAATVNGYFADPSTNGSFSASAWRTDLSVLTAAEIAAAYQPLNADLTAIAGLTTASYGRSLLTQSTAAAARTTLGINNDPAFTVLKSAMDNALRSASVTVCGDSIGNEDTEWVYLFSLWLATQYPNWTVNYQVWNVTSQSYLDPVRLQTGTAGKRYMTFDGASTPLPFYADSTALTDDICVDLPIIANDYTPSAKQTMFRKGTGTTIGFDFNLKTDGYLEVVYSKGISDYGYTYTSTSGITGVTDGATPIRVRFFYDRDNGAGGSTCYFWYSTDDGENWTSLGSQTRTTNNLIYQTTGAWYLGGATSTQLFSGKIGAPRVTQAVTNGIRVLPIDIDFWSYISANTQTLSGAPVLNVYNASISGQTLAYHIDGSRVNSIFLDPQCRFVVALSSHNYGTTAGSSYWTLLDAFVTGMIARCTSATVIGATSNPEYSPIGQAVGIIPNAQRNVDFQNWCRKNGYRCAQVFDYFFANAVPYTDYVLADGVHPNPAGSALILAVMQENWK